MDNDRIEQARSIISRALVWDMTLPWIYPSYVHPSTLPRFSAAGFNVVSLTVGGTDNSLEACLKSLAMTKAMIRENDKHFVQAYSVADIEAARDAGKLALLFNFQETNSLLSDPNLVQVYYDLGVRHMLLAYNRKNAVGDGCAERTDAGLSRVGVRVVEEMNRVGMLVDGSHTGKRTTLDAIEVCEGPFIFSHSNAKSVFDHYRNIDDEQIRACANTGGVIGINGLGEFLDDVHASAQSIFKHVDYVANLAGIDHVGLALDYVEDTAWFWNWVRDNPDAWPENNSRPHVDTAFAGPEVLEQLVECMLAAAYSEEDIEKVLGKNFRRVCLEVWK